MIKIVLLVVCLFLIQYLVYKISHSWKSLKRDVERLKMSPKLRREIEWEEWIEIENPALYFEFSKRGELPSQRLKIDG